MWVYIGLSGKNPSGPGDLKGLKQLTAHLMRSGFAILACYALIVEGLLYVEVLHWFGVFKEMGV